MFCKYCGSNIDDKAVICPHCGVPIDNVQQPLPPAYYQPQSRTNGIGIAGFIVALVGLCGGNFFFIIPGIVGIILSFVGLIKAKKQNLSSGMSIAGICVSVVSLIFWIYVWVEAFKLIAAEGIYPPIV